MKIKNYRSTLARLVLLVGLVVAANAQADVLEEILDRGTIRVGVSLFEPWAMKNPSGELVGHEIEVAKKLAADLGGGRLTKARARISRRAMPPESSITLASFRWVSAKNASSSAARSRA